MKPPSLTFFPSVKGVLVFICCILASFVRALAGVAGAIANAIYYDTGVRARELPIKLETLLA